MTNYTNCIKIVWCFYLFNNTLTAFILLTILCTVTTKTMNDDCIHVHKLLYCYFYTLSHLQYASYMNGFFTFCRCSDVYILHKKYIKININIKILVFFILCTIVLNFKLFVNVYFINIHYTQWNKDTTYI